MKRRILNFATVLLLTSLAVASPIDDGLRRDPDLTLLSREDGTIDAAPKSDIAGPSPMHVAYHRCCSASCGVCRPREDCEMNEECGPGEELRG
ncbi:hypothetical protein LTR53_015680 [Teratosphaeriaceae sp. CCFEE 6253]|nr:hypothetical protein LTR53_015680 [Teratosphaeriaceae sp. CCFEE 6253]